MAPLQKCPKIARGISTLRHDVDIDDPFDAAGSDDDNDSGNSVDANNNLER